jgi:type 1 glutamine amidotransferase/HEAT repeat protein
MKINKKLSTLAIIVASLLFGTEIIGQVTSAQEAKISKALPKQVVKNLKNNRRLLVFSRTEGYRHDAIPFANKAIELMGKKTGAFETVFSEEMSVFEPESLKEFDAIVLNNTTNLKFEDPALRQSLLQFVKNGKGLMGIHAATDNFYNWPEAAEMMGGQFDGHPWDGQGIWAVEVSDPNHILNQGFENKKFKINDEIYHHKKLKLRENSRVLISLDMQDSVNLSPEGVHFTDKDIPISWVSSFGNGRIFYCSFGHTPAIYWNSEILTHYFAGIQFLLGDLPAETKPLDFDINAVLDFHLLSENLAQISRYEFGESREAHKDVRQFVSLASQSQKATLRTEKELIKFLKSNATLSGKQFVCHLLADIGSDASINTLAEMLYDSFTVEMARFALEKIPNKSADEVLRTALMKSESKVKIGIINSLGKRRDEESVQQIKKMIFSSDEKIARSAIAALGRIASEEAITTLEDAKNKVSPENRQEIVFALLDCSDALLLQNNNDRAYRIYEELFAVSEKYPVRFAALRGMVNSSSEEDVDRLLINVMLKENSEICSGVPMIVEDIPADYDISGLIAALPSFKAVDQVRLLNALSNRKDDYILQMATQLSKHENQTVRLDAFVLIGKVGDFSSVQYLAEVSVQKTSDGKAAQNALYQLAGERVDLEIVRLIPDANDEVKFQLIRSLRMRRPKDKNSKISGALLQTASTEKESLRIESIRALQFIAGKEQLQELIDIFIKVEGNRERSAIEKTIVVTAHKVNGDSLATQIMLLALSNSDDIQTRRSLLLVLAKVGHSSALPAFKKAMLDSSETLQTAAITALAEWSTDAPIKELETIIRESSNPMHRTLALRGFLRMANLPGEYSDQETSKRFQLAMELSETDDDKKMVLSGLSKQKSFSAFQMAKEKLDNPALRAEAEVAVVNIAETTLRTNTDETKKVLLEIRQNSNDDGIIEQAQKHINEIEKYEGYITLWQLSKVYSSDSDDDFYFEFPPEKMGEKVEWTTMTEISDKNSPWQVNLTNIFGGNFCAGYLRTNIWSDIDQTARIELGSNDGIKAWFNGELIHSNDLSRTVGTGDDIVEINLKKGWNSVMLKIRQLGGSWGASARIRNVDGSEIENLKYQPKRDE